MGLFNRGNKKASEKTYSELYDETMARIEAAHYLVSLDFAIGQYGNDDIIAGSMIGSTGKYLMMSKYGDLKWDTTTMALKTDGVEIHYNGVILYYSDILDVQVSDAKGFLNVEKQMILLTRQGNYIFKSSAVFIDAVADLIVGSRDRYNGWINDGLISPREELSVEELERLIRGEPLERKNNKKEENDVDGANVDRVLRAAELNERGLLSDEEFEEIKNKLLKHDLSDDDGAVEVARPKFCPSCGTKIQEECRFCINCGHEL